MKPGAVVMVVIAVIGGGVLLLRWRRNAQIEAREQAADVAQVLPFYLAHKDDVYDEADLLDPDEAMRQYRDLYNSGS